MYADNFGPQEILPNQPSQRISSGGESSRWLNISQIVAVGGGDPDSKIFICEVCQNHSNPDEECHVTNYTSWLIGAPPVAINGFSTGKMTDLTQKINLSKSVCMQLSF